MTQLDLFDEVVSGEQQHRVDALTCLRDEVPEALEVVTELRYRRAQDTRSPRCGSRWAYCVCRAGLRFEAESEWWSGARDRGETWGWNRTPAHLITWGELGDLVGADPRRDEITAWVDSLPQPRWQLLVRPHELWPNPDQWNLSYLCRDHVDLQWTNRRHAWQLVIDLLNDAIDRR